MDESRDTTREAFAAQMRGRACERYARLSLGQRVAGGFIVLAIIGAGVVLAALGFVVAAIAATIGLIAVGVGALLRWLNPPRRETELRRNVRVIERREW